MWAIRWGLSGAVHCRRGPSGPLPPWLRGQSTIDNPLTTTPRPQIGRPNRRRRALLGVAAAAILAALLIIVFSGGGSGPKHSHAGSRPGSVLQVAAGYLGVAPSDVRRRLNEGQTLAQIAASSKGRSRHGLIETVYAAKAAQIKRLHLSPQQERAALRDARRSLVAQVDRARRRARLHGAAALYLGLSAAELQSRLAAGQSLASVAQSLPGHSRKRLLDAIVGTRREAVERAVKEKRISAAEGGTTISTLRRRAERQIERSGG